MGAVLLVVGYLALEPVSAQGSKTRFGFLEEQRLESYLLRPGYGVYSTTALPPVNTYGFKHAGGAVERGARVALIRRGSSALPSGGSSIPPPNLMVVSGLRPGTAAPTSGARRLFARNNTNLGLRTTNDGYYIMPRTRNLPTNSRTTVRRSKPASKKAAAPKTKRRGIGLRSLFGRSKAR